MRRYSVIICSYNKLESLKKVVASLSEIDRDNEYILSDDYSTDGTIEWAKESGFFDQIIEMKEDKGYCLNTVRNNGIRAAKNQIAVLLDADCVPEPDYFNGHDIVFDKTLRCISVGFTNFFNTDGTKLLKNNHRLKWLGTNKQFDIKWNAVYGGNIAIPRNIWAEVGQFDERFNGAWGLDDAEFAYRATTLDIPMVIHNLSLVRHLQHPVSGTVEMRSGRGPNTKKFKDKHGFMPC